jgi:hypothetical protein
MPSSSNTRALGRRANRWVAEPSRANSTSVKRYYCAKRPLRIVP